jgi:hypothetical protein
MNPMQILSELISALADTYRQGDLPGHLREWWWAVSHPDLHHTPLPAPQPAPQPAPPAPEGSAPIIVTLTRRQACTPEQIGQAVHLTRRVWIDGLTRPQRRKVTHGPLGVPFSHN